MSIVIATGNAILDDHIKRFVGTSTKVNYLEEIKEVINNAKGVKVALLSSFLPSAHDETEQRKETSFQEVIEVLLDNEVRVVFLTDTDLPIDSLYYLFEKGIYDFIVSQDGNVSLDEIVRKTKESTSKEEAKQQLESLVKVLPKASHRASEEETVLYHELGAKKASVYEESPESFQKPKEVETEAYQHLDFKKEVVETVIEEEKKPLLEKEVVREFSPVKPVREKSSSKAGVKSEEPKIFSFWGSSENLGKRTLSQSFAVQVARLGYSVLYCEFDYQNPALALTTALSNNDKNFYQLALSQDTFDLRQFIANKMDVRITKEMVGLFEEIPHELHFLGLPSGFDPDTFPSITNEDFLETLLSALKEVEYDAVVINLPNEIENLFSFPVMLESDVVFSVISANPVRISNHRSLVKMLADTPLNMDKWEIIVNQVGEGVSKDTCEQLLREQVIAAVPFDMERSSYELDLRFGSPVINQKMTALAGIYGFLAPETNEKKKGLFGLLR